MPNHRGSISLYSILKNLNKTEILALSQKTCPHRYSLLTHPHCLRRYLQKPERIGFLDIEASHLKANWGIIFSVCIKKMDGKTWCKVLTPKEIRSFKFDKNLLKEVIQEMKKYDRIIYYYGRRFDIPTLRTRSIYYHLNFPLYKEIKGFDLFYVVKYKLNLHNNRMETACKFFHIPCKEHRLNEEIWLKATAGDKKSLNWIKQHNKEDVISLEALFKKLQHYTNIPNSSI